jgi:phage-related protein
MSGADWRFYKYRDKDGNDPVWDFLEKQTTSGEQAQIAARMLMVMEQGVRVSGDIVENLGGGLYVLRAPNTPNNPRIFMCVRPGFRGDYVMLHAYRKKGDKIPEREMRIALKRQKEVQSQPDQHIV